jgi:hypothetical protein
MPSHCNEAPKLLRKIAAKSTIAECRCPVSASIINIVITQHLQRAICDISNPVDNLSSLPSSLTVIKRDSTFRLAVAVFAKPPAIYKIH